METSEAVLTRLGDEKFRILLRSNSSQIAETRRGKSIRFFSRPFKIEVSAVLAKATFVEMDDDA